MAYQFSIDDVAFLASPDGAAALDSAAALPLTDASLLKDLPALRKHYGSSDGALVETVRNRRRAADKLVDADRLLLTDIALQQATPTAVRTPGSRHREALPGCRRARCDLLDRCRVTRLRGA